MVNSPLASISHLVRELPQGPTSANPVMTMTLSRSTTPRSLATFAKDSEGSRVGKSKRKLARGVTLTVWSIRSASKPFMILKSAELSLAIARRRSLFLLRLRRIRVVMSARSGRRSMPPLRSAQIGSTCVMLNRRGCMRPRMLKAISLAENVRTP